MVYNLIFWVENAALSHPKTLLSKEVLYQPTFLRIWLNLETTTHQVLCPSLLLTADEVSRDTLWILATMISITQLFKLQNLKQDMPGVYGRRIFSVTVIIFQNQCGLLEGNLTDGILSIRKCIIYLK